MSSTGASAIPPAEPVAFGWVVLTDIGRVRKTNEDSAAVLPPGDGYLSGAIVCDGVGGAEAGEVASRLGVERVSAGLAGSRDLLPERLHAAITDANRAIRDHARDQLGGAPSGSTLVMALLMDGQVTIANVGDSRAYLYRAAELRQLTADHSFVAEQVRLGLIRAEDAATHPLRSRLTKALGTADTVDPEIHDHDLRPGDVLLLCSDGLHGVVGDLDIAAALGSDPAEAARALVDLANRRGGKDNISVAVCRVGEGGGHSAA